MIRLLSYCLTMAALFSGPAIAALQSGSLNGMNYYVQPASDGCSSSAPCSVLLYLGYMGDNSQASEVQQWFSGPEFSKTIVVAPVNLAAQSEADSWGGYTSTKTTQGTDAINILRAVEAQYGNSINPHDVGVTGGSLGGAGTQALLALYGPNGTNELQFGASFDAKFPSASAADIKALCGVPLLATHGTADTNQPYSYDVTLSSQLAAQGCSGFQLNPIQGAPHGTWGSAYSAGSGSGTVIGWLTQQFQNHQSNSTVQASSQPTDQATITADVAPVSISCPTPTATPVAGAFSVSGGKIIGPDGQPFVARGIDVWDADLGDMDLINAKFTGINFIRLSSFSLKNTPDTFRSFIEAETARGVVVMIDDHHNFPAQAFTGGELDATTQWWATMAGAFGSNERVWYQTQNEPQGGAASAGHAAAYKAIRGAGSNSMILFNPLAGVKPQAQGLDVPVYVTMFKVAFDQHIYPWEVKGMMDQTAIEQAVMALSAQLHQVMSADGPMPTLYGEIGPSTDALTVDANGDVLIEALVTLATSGRSQGLAAWAWKPRAPEDQLLQNSNANGPLTDPYGTRIQLFINTPGAYAPDRQPCTVVAQPQPPTTENPPAPANPPTQTKRHHKTRTAAATSSPTSPANPMIQPPPPDVTTAITTADTTVQQVARQPTMPPDVVTLLKEVADLLNQAIAELGVK